MSAEKQLAHPVGMTDGESDSDSDGKSTDIEDNDEESHVAKKRKMKGKEKEPITTKEKARLSRAATSQMKKVAKRVPSTHAEMGRRCRYGGCAYRYVNECLAGW